MSSEPTSASVPECVPEPVPPPEAECPSGRDGHAVHESPVTRAFTQVTTARLMLRRPREEDRAAYIAVHTDPRLYGPAPAAVLSVPDADQAFTRMLQSWDQDGFGYWVAVDRGSGAVIGVAGVRPEGAETANLYYRFDADRHGLGLGREAARAAVGIASEWLPGRRVEADIRDAHVTSIRVATAAGLERVDVSHRSREGAATTPASRYAAPTLARVDALTDTVRADLLDLWARVTDAGGSVGFLPGAPRERIAAALAEHEAQMDAGAAYGAALRHRDGRLAGWGWWVRSVNPLLAHGRWLYRLMVDPRLQGRNLGTILLAGMIGLARAEGAELLVLGYRSGSGLGQFYGRFGFTEVGRIPAAIRVAPGDDRDDVTMARRVDAAPMRADGRT